MAAVPKLRGKQARFVEEYLKDLNGKQAALRAGYSPRCAEVLASQTLNAWCELAKPLKRKGKFPDTQTESRLVQVITLLFSTTVFQ